MLHNTHSGDDTLQAQLNKLREDGYELLDFKNHELENEIYRWIALKRSDVLGRGSYGNVYKAYPVDIETGELIKSKKLAVKIFKNSKHVNPSEAKFFDSYYAGCELIYDQSDIYMVMTCLPGKNILNDKKRGPLMNAEINQFDFTKRVDLIYNIMMAINLIHHNTPNTGNALIHGDINGSNIKVHDDQETEQINVYIMDFGLAKEADDDPDMVQHTEMEGTPLYMPNEVVEHEVHGIKSDIYALTPIFAAIFGAVDPFALKTKLPFYNPEYYKTPYDFTGMFLNYVMPELPFDLQNYIVKFLNRMQDETFDKRPDSDETLRFFTTLNKLCKIIAVGNRNDDIYVCGAKLAILADGLWKDTPEQTNDTEIEKQFVSPAPEHFDFDDPTAAETSKQIITAANKTPLNSPLLHKILSQENIAPSQNKSTLFSKPSYLEEPIPDVKNDVLNTF